MKKFYFVALMTLMAITASAQQALQLSTYAGTNLQKYDGQECKVTVTRYLFHGWNTFSLPFALSEDEMNEAFGSDCRLERLVGVESVGKDMVLNFQDCKAQGMEANVPYILWYNGENANKRIAKLALISDAPATVSFSDKGTTVTMACAQKQFDGKGCYGVLAKDNAEAKFTKVDETITSGFFATRCYIRVENGNPMNLLTNHLAAGEATGIDAISVAGKSVDVYNLSGQKVATKANKATLRSLAPGVYVINGQKVLVK